MSDQVLTNGGLFSHVQYTRVLSHQFKRPLLPFRHILFIKRKKREKKERVTTCSHKYKRRAPGSDTMMILTYYYYELGMCPFRGVILNNVQFWTKTLTTVYSSTKYASDRKEEEDLS
jgi:hypothetical protein